MVTEFDLGYVVWTRQPADVPVEPGDGARAVIDRRTGRIHHYPALPVPIVIEQFIRDHAGDQPPRTVDAIASFDRLANRVPTPGVRALLRLASDPRIRAATGTKADASPMHHPVVQSWLDSQAAGELVRGAERHAELITVSETLYELNVPAELRAARALLSGAEAETFHLREAGDPIAGQPAQPCPTCIALYAHLEVLAAQPDTDTHGYTTAVRRRTGRRHRIQPYVISAAAAPPCPRTLADFGDVLGSRVIAIGQEGESGIVVADERDRIFVLDQAGEWYLGPDIESAVVTLETGGDQPRVRDDGTWIQPQPD